MSFRLFDIEITVSVLFLSYASFVLLIKDGGIAAFSLCCMLLHELGHIGAAAILGTRPDKIKIALGHFEISGGEPLPRGKHAVVLLGGVAVNAVLAAFFIAVGSRDFFAVNLVLILFNLLPAVPLDGGNLLLIVLGELTDFDRAQRITGVTTGIVAAAVLALGTYLVVRFHSASLVAFGIFLLLSAFGG